MCIIITKVELLWLQGEDILHIVKYYPPSNLGEIIIEYEGTEDCNLAPVVKCGTLGAPHQ